jgi:hypothetical protein
MTIPLSANISWRQVPSNRLFRNFVLAEFPGAAAAGNRGASLGHRDRMLPLFNQCSAVRRFQ